MAETMTNEQLAELIQREIGGLNQRIDGVEQSLGERIDGVEQSLGERINGLDKKIDGVEQSLGKRIDVLAADVSEFRVEFNTFRRDVNVRFDSLEERFDREEQYTSDLYDKVVSPRFDRIEGHLGLPPMKTEVEA